MKLRLVAGACALVLLLAAASAAPVAACGGFFCTTIPVDQSGERIIFTMDPGSITTYVQITYVGRPEDFAWVLPVPNNPKIDVADMATFRDLNRLTQPIYIGPRPPSCLRLPVMASAPAARSAGAPGESVTVVASGDVGPFGYHVVTSPDPQDMVIWLRQNGYRITPEMEPLVKLYTDDGLMFLAMKLRPGQASNDVVPVKLTYESSLPMIPLRLTAVAATPDMPVFVWIFANDQTQPVNFVPIKIADSEISFSPFGANDYLRVVSRAVDQAGGRAFVTEFAGPTNSLRPATDPVLQLLMQQYPYLTRLYTRISPDEMTVDPLFDLSPGQADVSNVHDLSNKPAPWQCNDGPGTFRPVSQTGPPPTLMAGGRYVQGMFQGGGPKAGLLFAIVGLTAFFLLRKKTTEIATMSGNLRRSIRNPLADWELTPRAISLLLLETVVLQGFHEMEHIVQVLQRTVFGVASGAGMLGSLFDIEPVHMVYNAAFLALLGAVYIGCRRVPSAIPQRTSLVMGLLGGSLAFQTYHTVEHAVKMWQYFAWGINGTPGIVGYWIPVVYLHLLYNTLVFIPVLLALVIGGFGAPIGEAVRQAFWPRRRSRRMAI